MTCITREVKSAYENRDIDTALVWRDEMLGYFDFELIAMYALLDTNKSVENEFEEFYDR